MTKRKRLGLILLGIAAITITGLHLQAQPARQHPFFNQFERQPLVIAHAGSELYPTDTMYALEHYAAMGVDILEMDVHTTKDGVIVLIHDNTVDRTTNGSGTVWEMTFDEISQLDAAYNFTLDDGATYPLRGQGITIPALQEVLTTFSGYPMVIEIKQEAPSMAAQLCAELRQHNMQEQVIIASFSDLAMQEFRAACPETATAASSGEVKKFVYLNFALMTGIISPEYEALQVPEERDGIPIVTRLLLWAAERQNVDVHIWTVNDPEDMQRFIGMGLGGIMTDRTDLLIELLDQ